MELIHRIQELTGIAEAEEAQGVARTVLARLFEQLSPLDRTWLALELPASLRATYKRRPFRPVHRLEEFFERIARSEGVDLGLAAEHARSVCRALEERLDEDVRRVLTGRLPDALVELFARSAAPRTLALPGPIRLRARSLAEARPGSRSPLSEAGPAPAHQDSVAVSENPHRDTKLSSSVGSTQEREGETLADAHHAERESSGRH